MSVEDTRELEKALEERGLDSFELMQRAGAAVAVQAAELAQGGPVVVLCGSGNNGGDGWIAAANLHQCGLEVDVVCAAAPSVMLSLAARKASELAAQAGVRVHVAPGVTELAELFEQAEVLVDACFGTGLHEAMPEPFASWAMIADELFCGKTVAVDVPSGINATTGMAEGAYFAADVTVAMFAAKPGLVSGEGRAAAGKVAIAPLVEDDEAGMQGISDAASAFILDERDYLDVLPQPDRLADKYGRGQVLVVAGSSRYPGAAVLAATAAARSGAGYVRLAVPAPCVPIAQMQLPAVPVVGLAADAEGAFAPEAAEAAAKLAEHVDVVVCGPGLTLAPGGAEVVRALLATKTALVLDADALNAVVKICAGSAEERPQALRREGPLVLTPHRRELARLAGGDLERTQSLAGAMEVAQSLVWAVGSGDFCVVAKGPDNAVAGVDSTLVVQPGPASLATAGTGDVLAGIVGGLLAQTLAPLQGEEEGLESSDLLMLVAAADRVHAVAGHLAARRHGTRGVMAQDVAEVVGLAIDELERAAERDFMAAGGDADLGDEDEDGEDYSIIDSMPVAPEAIAQRMAAASTEYAAEEEPDMEPEEPAGFEGAAEGDADDVFGEAGVREVPDPEDEGEAAAAQVATEEAPAQEQVAEAAAECDEGAEAPGDDALAAQDAPVAAPAAAQPQAPLPAADPGETTVLPLIDPSKTSVIDLSAAQTVAAQNASAQAAPATAAPQEPAQASEPSPAPQAAQTGSSLPPFLAPEPAAASAEPPASDEPAADSSVPPFLAGVADQQAEEEEPARKLTPEEKQAAELARWHENATLRIGDMPVIPPEARPSASKGSSKRPSRS